MTKLTLALYHPHEMAFVKIKEQRVFTGNYHDFHLGCHGGVIGGYDISKTWVQGLGPGEMIKALIAEIEKPDTVVYERVILSNEEYNREMGYKAV